MATLVLSTVGTTLGGPVGGAIGALIGQSIDQELLAPSRRGPRIGDLSVQSSGYGTQIPRIYGTMRVAGSVIWSTDLVESNQVAGAKGQPDTTYSYSVSFAVAVSSREVQSIGRIWADGKLLRGAEGDLKVSGTFRLLDGSADQIIDPLIGSIEGIDNTPAYRGLALAVFENLELADYGNRIPFLTFEIVADEDSPAISAILSDVSDAAIICDAAQRVIGYAAYGASIASAANPLVDCFGISLFDDGSVIRGPASSLPLTIEEGEFGSSAEPQPVSRMHREQTASGDLPTVLRLSYYDPSLDYQTGEARASASEQRGNEAERELPAALSAGDAKSLAHEMLARSWAQRDKLVLHLPMARIPLEPGTKLELPLSPARWIIEKCTIDSYVAVVELRAEWAAIPTLAAGGGRILPGSDIIEQPLTLALLDIPDVTGNATNQPVILLAASTPSRGWRRRAVSMEIPGQVLASQTAARKSVLGNAVSGLAGGACDLIDLANTVDVQLIDQDQWLTECDDEALSEGHNLALLGKELFQFGTATPLGSGRFRLGRLLRGRRGTEWATSLHEAGDTFCLILADTFHRIALPAWCSGATISASAAMGTSTSILLSGESVRPVSPIDASAAIQPGGDLLLSWTRRSRSGWAWIDEIDAPLGEAREQYRVTVTGTAASLELVCSEPSVSIDAATLAPCGVGAASIEIRQLGDAGASRPAQLLLTLP